MENQVLKFSFFNVPEAKLQFSKKSIHQTNEFFFHSSAIRLIKKKREKNKKNKKLRKCDLNQELCIFLKIFQ